MLGVYDRNSYLILNWDQEVENFNTLGGLTYSGVEDSFFIPGSSL